MKSILSAILLISSVSLSASATTNLVTLSERTVLLNVDISAEKVKLSSAGYSMPTVKVLVPDLADVTILNHRNYPESAPCLATKETNNPEDVIQGNPASEKVKFTVKLEKSIALNEQNICKVVLVESISGKIRGFTFQHQRTLESSDRVAEDCR